MKCLIVDDSTTMRKIVRGIIETFNFLCSESADGLEAVEACKEDMPDLIMLDWNMPNMNGLEFLVALRSMKNGKHPKVIFCTTENSLEFIQNGLKAGADEYIMKPFDKDIIESKLSYLGILTA